MKKETLTVKEVSKKLHLSQHTIRYYCDIGLVPSIQRDKNNIRVFNQESINWLIAVKHLKDCGMSLESIKRYIELCLIGKSATKERYTIIKKQHEHAQLLLQEAKERVDFLKHKLDHYEEILQNQIEDDMNPINW